MSALSDRQVEDDLATLAAHLYAGTCRWLDLVAEVDQRGRWTEHGFDSCAAWIAWRCALTPRAAREHVRVARRLPELPATHAAFACGELSYAKVRALTRVATAENEEELLHPARTCTAAQLERVLRAYRRVTLQEAREVQEDAYLSVFWDHDGALEIRGRLAPEDGALVLRALDALRDSLWQNGRGSAEPRPARQASNAEALVAVAALALAYEGDASGGETAAAASPAARTAASSTPTTSTTGRRAARRRSRTSCCSAAPTTVRSTKAVTESTPTAGSSTAGGSRWGRRRRCRAATRKRRRPRRPRDRRRHVRIRHPHRERLELAYGSG